MAQLLEAQGALVEEDGRTLRVLLMSTQPEAPRPAAAPEDPAE